MKLYTNKSWNMFTQVPLVVADLARVRVELVCVTEEQEKDKDFKAKKLANYPFLECEDGSILFESAAIATYLASCNPDRGLYGNTPFQQAKCDEWINWA